MSTTRLETALAQAIDRGLRALSIVALVACALWLTTGIRRVGPGEQVLVLRAGAVRAHRDTPGLIWAWPRPFEEVISVPARDRALSLSVSLLDRADPSPQPALAPRGDGGYVVCAASAASGAQGRIGGLLHLRAQVIYEVADARHYALGVADVPALLERAFAAAAVRECAGRSVDAVMVHDLDGVQAAIATRINRRLARSDSDPGIRVRRVDLTVGLPAIAREAFATAQSAATEASRAVAQARSSAREHRQEATRRAEQRRGQAQGAAAERVSRAQIVANDIAALLEGGSGASPRSLRERVWNRRVLPLLRAARRCVVLAPAQGDRLLVAPRGGDG